MFQTDDGTLLREKGVGARPDISTTFADAAVDFIKRKPQKPFFLHVNFFAPHDPLLLPPGYEDRYKPEEIPVPPNFLPEHPFDTGYLKTRDELLFAWPRTRNAVRDELAMYYLVISHMDEQIGRILKTLQATGQAARTIVIFASDQGVAIGSHGLRGKQNMYEHTIGRTQRMIRTDRWKLIHYPKIGRSQLFDLSADPHEINDLAASSEHSTVVSDLRAKLEAQEAKGLR